MPTLPPPYSSSDPTLRKVSRWQALQNRWVGGGLHRWFSRRAYQARLRLSQREALPQLVFLGILIGLFSSLIVILFRALLEFFEPVLLRNTASSSYDALPLWGRFAAPVIGSLLLYALFRKGYSMGIVHIMERLAYHQGKLPLKHAVLQFFGAAIALVSGHSVGREGPSAHLGATAASLTGQRLGLPNNTIRTLVGCGVAAAIAASFNTPLAGVIFAVEVVLLEYTVVSMAPIIMSAVAATWFTKVVYHSERAFDIGQLPLPSTWELPFMLLVGLAIGLLSAGFSDIVERVTKHTRQRSLFGRFMAAGVIVGSIGVFAPDVMGIGYSLLADSLTLQLGLGFCVAICLLKLVASAAAAGLGIPGGLIGPTLVIGATAGHAMGLIGQSIVPELSGEPGFYALLGMAAMMGTVLQAPLAALLAILELTNNPAIILPGMMVVITAMITSRQFFSKDSIFISLMRLSGLDYRNDPLTTHRRSLGVSSAMSKSFRVSITKPTIASLKSWRSEAPDWLLVQKPGVATLVAGADVFNQLERWQLEQDKLAAEHKAKFEAEAKAARDKAEAESIVKDGSDSDTTVTTEPATPEYIPYEIDESKTLSLLDIPADRRQAALLPYYSSLQDAFQAIENDQAEAVVIVAPQWADNDEVLGILTRDMIYASYR